MKAIHVSCYSKGEVIINDDARTNGINIVLVDEKGIPVARYTFDGNKVSNLTGLLYEANNVRIHFYGDIIPTTTYELTSFNDYHSLITTR